MAYLSWKDLLDEEAPDGEASGVPTPPVEVSNEAREGAPPPLPTREELVRQIPGLAELVQQRKALEAKMRGLLGQPEEKESSQREKQRFPMVQHTPESRILDRRLFQRDAETHLANQRALAERNLDEAEEMARGEAKRRREAEKVARHRLAQAERLRLAELARKEHVQQQLTARWQGAREAEQKATALRQGMERSRMDRLDLLRIASASAHHRESATERVREGVRRGWAEHIPIPLARRKADGTWAKDHERQRTRLRRGADVLGRALKSPDRLIDDADRALEPKLRPLRDRWREVSKKMDAAFEPPPPSGDAEQDEETREALAEAKKQMHEDLPMDDLDAQAERAREKYKEKAKEKVRELAAEARRRAFRKRKD